jgi:hypothetical protein
VEALGRKLVDSSKGGAKRPPVAALAAAASIACWSRGRVVSVLDSGLVCFESEAGARAELDLLQTFVRCALPRYKDLERLELLENLGNLPVADSKRMCMHLDNEAKPHRHEAADEGEGLAPRCRTLFGQDAAPVVITDAEWEALDALSGRRVLDLKQLLAAARFRQLSGVPLGQAGGARGVMHEARTRLVTITTSNFSGKAELQMLNSDWRQLTHAERRMRLELIKDDNLAWDGLEAQWRNMSIRELESAMALPDLYVSGQVGLGFSETDARHALGDSFNLRTIYRVVLERLGRFAPFERINVVSAFDGIGVGPLVFCLLHMQGLITLGTIVSIERDAARHRVFVAWLRARQAEGHLLGVEVENLGDITDISDASFRTKLLEIGGAHAMIGGSPCAILPRARPCSTDARRLTVATTSAERTDTRTRRAAVWGWRARCRRSSSPSSGCCACRAPCPSPIAAASQSLVLLPHPPTPPPLPLLSALEYGTYLYTLDAPICRDTMRRVARGMCPVLSYFAQPPSPLHEYFNADAARRVFDFCPSATPLGVPGRIACARGLECMALQRNWRRASPTGPVF